MEYKKLNKLLNITKQKQTYRYREQISGYQWGGGTETGKGIKKCKQLCIQYISCKDIFSSTDNMANV